MRHIEKGPAPEAFEAWKRQANNDWEPTWSALQNPEKQAVKDALVTEQGGLCAYCCRRIEATPRSSHIEHVASRQARPNLALAYENFVASCPGEPEPEDEPEPVSRGAQTCGHHKGEWYDPDRFVDPREPACEQAFSFMGNGRTRVADAAPRPEAAQETIRRLNLDCSSLRRQRARVLGEELDRLARLLRARGGLRQSDVTARLDQLRERGRDGTFVPFQPALLDVLGQRAASLPAE